MKHFLTSTFFLIVLFFISITQAQEKELFVAYNFLYEGYEHTNQIFEVTSTKSNSISILKQSYNKKLIAENLDEDFSEIPVTPIYKNYKDNYLISQESFGLENFYTKESLNQMQWQLTGNIKTILKYNCQEATTTFRGRDYIAYFTTELPFKAAPFKFYGLPGVILLIHTIDNNITFEASILKIKPKSKTVTNPFADKKTMSWDKFVSIYKKMNKNLNEKARINRMGFIKSAKKEGHDVSDMEAVMHIEEAEPRIEIIVKANDWVYLKKQYKKAKE